MQGHIRGLAAQRFNLGDSSNDDDSDDIEETAATPTTRFDGGDEEVTMEAVAPAKSATFAVTPPHSPFDKRSGRNKGSAGGPADRHRMYSSSGNFSATFRGLVKQLSITTATSFKVAKSVSHSFGFQRLLTALRPTPPAIMGKRRLHRSTKSLLWLTFPWVDS